MTMLIVYKGNYLQIRLLPLHRGLAKAQPREYSFKSTARMECRRSYQC